ncbi:Uncharacterised protein [Mycobacteroides abscessus subsp. abscessus]|nr:Uncharacterised protein [Mycobacteroides abscessus subsp. abscessus]
MFSILRLGTWTPGFMPDGPSTAGMPATRRGSA